MSGSIPEGGRSSGPAQASLSQSPIADQEAERAVLGALLMYGEPNSVIRLSGLGLAPESFYWEHYAAIYAAIYALAKRRVGADSITVNAEMERLGTSTDSTWRELEDLPSWVPVSANVAHYADIVITQSRWRERRRRAYAMLESVERRDVEAWEKSVEVFVPNSAPIPAQTHSGPSTLRLVNEDGEVVGQETHCDGCNALQDQLDGAQREIAGWRTRYANLERDKDKAAAKDALWLPAQALFEHWRTLTDHKRCKWTPGRFRACEPMLKAYGVEMFARAIAGIADDPYTKVRKNGTTQKFNSWESLTKSVGAFEEYANRAPRGWKFTLNISVQDEQAIQPRLRLAKEAS